MKKVTLKKMGIACAAVLMLAGCADPFVGEYQFENSSETLTVKSDGTCVDVANGLKQACEWEKEGKDEYTITMNTMLGKIVFDVEKTAKDTYSVSTWGVHTTMRKK